MKCILPTLLAVCCALSNCNNSATTSSKRSASPTIITADPDWEVSLITRQPLNGHYSGNCAQTGDCWYWSSSALWLVSDDGVKSVSLQLGQNEHILNSFLLTRDSGWLITTTRLLRTVDGGASWVEVPIRPFNSKNVSIYAAFLANEKQGWIAGGEYVSRTNNAAPQNNAISDDRQNVLRGAIFVTSDSGATWIKLRVPGSTGRFNRIVFSGALGLVSGDAGLFVTTDGGSHWKDVLASFRDSETGEVPEVVATYSFGEKKAWVSLSGGRLLLTEDGAASWNSIPLTKELGLDAPPFAEFVFTNDNVGLALLSKSGSGEIYKTKDGGKTWAPLTLRGNFSGLAVVPDSSRIFVSSRDGIYRLSSR